MLFLLSEQRATLGAEARRGGAGRVGRGLAASELWSELLGVFEERARDRSPHELVRQWTRDGFVALGSVDQRTTALGSQLVAYLFREAASK